MHNARDGPYVHRASTPVVWLLITVSEISARGADLVRRPSAAASCSSTPGRAGSRPACSSAANAPARRSRPWSRPRAAPACSSSLINQNPSTDPTERYLLPASGTRWFSFSELLNFQHGRWWRSAFGNFFCDPKRDFKASGPLTKSRCRLLEWVTT